MDNDRRSGKERKGKESLLAAVEVSIKKYRQVYEASDEELQEKGRQIIQSFYCGLCQRFIYEPLGCRKCLIDDGPAETCCPEWRDCSRNWGDWPTFRRNVQKLIERLEKEREKLLKPKPYVFQLADVAISKFNILHIICRDDAGKIRSMGLDGRFVCSNSQEDFENYGYKKIGVLSDFIKK